MLKWLRTIDWTAILGSALVLAFALWFLSANPGYGSDTTIFENSVVYAFTLLSPEAWTALFTCALFVSTFALWQVTQTAAEAARKSAEIAERSLTDLESPFLYPAIKSSSLIPDFRNFELYPHPSSPVAPVTPTVEFALHNYGRTPALLRTVSAAFDLLNKIEPNPLLDILHLPSGDPVLQQGHITNYAYKAITVTEVNKSGFASIKGGVSHLVLSGEVIYADIFGNDWIQTFCLTYYYEAKRFVAADGQYNRRQKKSRVSD
jgi:hypothetical protein